MAAIIVALALSRRIGWRKVIGPFNYRGIRRGNCPKQSHPPF
jgi:hypothetical protein